MRRGAGLVTVAASALLLAAATRAPFHLHLVKSVPEANATVVAPPDSIRLWFSQPPELAVTTVRVTGPGATKVALSPLARRDSTLVVAALRGKIAPGAYTVAWRTMAKDGHVARGTFGFSVGTGP